jgi:hypothetical protein
MAPGWDLDRDRLVGQIDVDEGVDRRVVRGQPARLRVNEVVGYPEIVVVHAQALGREPNRFE